MIDVLRDAPAPLSPLAPPPPAVPVDLPTLTRPPVSPYLLSLDSARGKDFARVRFWKGTPLVVNRPDLIHALLVERAHDFRKGPALSVNARPLLGNGLLTSDNELNRRQRKVISPQFAHKKVADYAGIVTRYTQTRLRERWADGATVDLSEETLAITLGVMGELLLSANLLTEASGVGDAITTLMNFAADEMRAPLRAIWSVPRALSALLYLNRTIHGRIEERRRAGDEEADLLSILLFARDENDQPMPTRLIRDEAMTLFLAGLETVAVSVAWTLYLLIQHPDAYARVQAELSDAVSAGRTPEPPDLVNLPFLLCAFKETLRLFPPAYIVARQALRPVTLGPDVSVARGDVIFVSPYVLHRDPANFPDPLAFRPERWENDYEKTLSRYAFLPFGSGPRVCPGGHFAFMEAHLILASLLQHAALSLVPDQNIEPEPLFTLRPADGIRVRVARL